MVRLYEIDGSSKKIMKQQMEEIAGKWRPYRTYACRYLWNAKDSI
jgi:DNA-3-methyladenine glycosylase II